MKLFAFLLHARRRALVGVALAVLLSVPVAFAVQHQVAVQADPYSTSSAVDTAGNVVDVSTPAGTVSVSVPSDFVGSLSVSVSSDGTITLSSSAGSADAGQSVTICLGTVCKTVTLDGNGKATVQVTASGIQ